MSESKPPVPLPSCLLNLSSIDVFNASLSAFLRIHCHRRHHRHQTFGSISKVGADAVEEVG
jgi:hypothetical protein